jgi:uncharacterized protein YndB with AHSA1/START domain
MESHMGTAKLSAAIAGDRDLVITRPMPAPRAKIFEAWTTPALLKQWLGPRSTTLAVCEIDLRIGGTYHMVWTMPGQPDLDLKGVYREIAAPGRLASSEVFNDWYDGESFAAVDLIEQGAGKTLITVTVRYADTQTRDMVHASPMKDGMAEGFDRLEELLGVAVLAG